jgi:hypothetical protein
VGRSVAKNAAEPVTLGSDRRPKPSVMVRAGVRGGVKPLVPAIAVGDVHWAYERKDRPALQRTCVIESAYRICSVVLHATRTRWKRFQTGSKLMDSIFGPILTVESLSSSFRRPASAVDRCRCEGNISIRLTLASSCNIDCSLAHFNRGKS